MLSRAVTTSISRVGILAFATLFIASACQVTTYPAEPTGPSSPPKPRPTKPPVAKPVPPTVGPAAVQITATPCQNVVCPAYTLVVSPTGDIRFEGRAGAAVQGEKTAKVGKDVIAQINAELRELRFFAINAASFPPVCSYPNPDATKLTIEAKRGPRKHRVDFYPGCANGGPVPRLVKFRDSVIRAVGARDWVGAQTSTTQTKGFEMRFSRGGCFGKCPVYEVIVTGDGNVTFVGKRFVAATGKQTAKVSQDVVKTIIERARAVGYPYLRQAKVNKACTSRHTDSPTTKTNILLDSVRGKISHYYGCKGDDLLNILRDFEKFVDTQLNTARWIKGTK